jgi:4-amino-4-deoxy-L-arabinose transferase-like glycosyltransferase
LLTVIAAVSAWVASRHGPLLSPDSVTYLSLARNLAAGRGYVDLTGRPNTTFAPGFPALLALGQLVGIAASTMARVVNTASYAALVVLAWVLLRRHVASRGVALAATVLVVISPPLLNVSAHAWSEPLFCVVVLAFILVLEEAVSGTDPRRQLLFGVGAGLLAGVAFMVRYAGLILVPVGVIVLVLSLGTARAKTQRIAAFVLAAAPLPAIWLLRNASSGAQYLMGPRIAANESFTTLGRRLAQDSVTMFVNAPSATRTRLLVLVPVVALVALGVFAAVRRRPGTTADLGRSRTLLPLVTFIVMYGTAVLVLGKTAGSSVDLRILMPGFVPLVVVGAVFVSRALTAARETPHTWARNVAYLMTFAVAIGAVSTSDAFVETSWSMGRAARGYATDTLTSSALARAVTRHARPSSIVTTNSPWALYSATGHQPVIPTPGEIYPSVSLPPATSDMLADAACAEPVFFAWYGQSAHPSTDLGGELTLTVVANVSDGVLYRVHALPTDCPDR